MIHATTGRQDVQTDVFERRCPINLLWIADGEERNCKKSEKNCRVIRNHDGWNASVDFPAKDKRCSLFWIMVALPDKEEACGHE